jgi:hypothetical protein
MQFKNQNFPQKDYQFFVLLIITSLVFVQMLPPFVVESGAIGKNTSSLLFASLQDDLRQVLRRSVPSLLNPFSLKSAIKADFLTLEPTIKGSDLIAQNILLNTGNNLNIESLQNQNHSKSKSTRV